MVVQRRDRGGLAINWGGELLALSRSEIGRLLAFIDGPSPHAGADAQASRQGRRRCLGRARPASFQYGSPVEEPTPAHDETSSGSASPTGERPSEGESTPAKPHGGQSGSEPLASDPAPPKLEVLVKEEKRSNEFWLALASIIVALVVGAIAAGSGWYTANRHDEQATMRQKINFTQAQQKEAYAGFINAASDVAIAIQLRVKAIENRYPYFLHSLIPEGKADVEAKFTDFGHALDLAQLYGSARVRDDSNKVFDAAAQSRLIIVGWEVTHPDNGPNDAPCPELLEFENKTESNRQQLANAIDHFNDAAREDLGIPPLPATSTPPEPLLPKDACTNYPR
jgi:hypothetical protein